MPRTVLESTDDEVEEVVPAPIKSSSGRVVKPSAALLDPSNVAKVPGQLRHAIKRAVEVNQEPPRKNKPKHSKDPGARSSCKDKDKDKETHAAVEANLNVNSAYSIIDT